MGLWIDSESGGRDQGLQINLVPRAPEQLPYIVKRAYLTTADLEELQIKQSSESPNDRVRFGFDLQIDSGVATEHRPFSRRSPVVLTLQHQAERPRHPYFLKGAREK